MLPSSFWYLILLQPSSSFCLFILPSSSFCYFLLLRTAFSLVRPFKWWKCFENVRNVSRESWKTEVRLSFEGKLFDQGSWSTFSFGKEAHSIVSDNWRWAFEEALFGDLNLNKLRRNKLKWNGKCSVSKGLADGDSYGLLLRSASLLALDYWVFPSLKAFHESPYWGLLIKELSNG